MPRPETLFSRARTSKKTRRTPKRRHTAALLGVVALVGVMSLTGPAVADPPSPDTPTLSQAFTPDLVGIGQAATLTYTLSNTATQGAAAGLAFTDTLPAGLTVAGGPAATTTCAGAGIDGDTAGSGEIRFTGGLADGAASCTVQVPVQAGTEGAYPSSGDDFTLTGLSAPDDATLTVRNPRITLRAALGSPRITAGDQFSAAIRSAPGAGTVVSDPSDATTAGSGSAVDAGTGTTGAFVADAGSTYYLNESIGNADVGATDLHRYATSIDCADSTGATTALPGGSVAAATTTRSADSVITPSPGADITCTLTNTGAAPTLHVATTVAGGRVAESDQFTADLSDGAIVLTSATTTGTATEAAGDPATGVIGVTYRLTETGSSAGVLAKYAVTYSCTDANAATTAFAPLAGTLGGGVDLVAPSGADLTCTVTDTRDTTAPAAPVITSPGAGTVTDDVTPTVSGTGEPGATVAVTDESGALCTATVGTDGAWLCTAPSLADGAHTLGATQTDPAGNVSDTSATRLFTVDTVAPASPVITVPLDGALTRDNTPIVSGTAESGAQVSVLEGATTLCATQASTSTPGTWSCATTTLPDGSHTLTAVATDAAGNASQPATAVDITVDTTAPAAPTIGAPAEGTITNDATPVISGAADTDSTVSVRSGGVTVCTALSDPTSGAWSCTSRTLTDGLRPVTATATDPAGNTSPASAARTFTVDTTAPAAPVISSPGPGEPIGDNTPRVNGTGEAGATVTISTAADGTLCTTTVLTNDTWGCTSDVALPDGAVVLMATQTDAAGNTSDPATVDITVDTTAPDAPVVAAPAAGSRPNAFATFIGTGEPGASVAVRDADGAICTATVQANKSWTCTPGSALAAGALTFTATQTDLAGNTSAPTTVTVTIDNSASMRLTSAGTLTDTDGDHRADLGDTIRWAYVVANTGNVTLTGVTVLDPLAGPVSCTTAVLAPGQRASCSTDRAHVVTQAEVDARSAHDSGVAHGVTLLRGGTVRRAASADAGPTLSVVTDGELITSNTVVAGVALDTRFALAAVKTATVEDRNGDGTTDAGDAVDWSILVRNAGNGTVTGIRVQDLTAQRPVCPATTLGPDRQMTCTVARQILTNADVAAGGVTNVASAHGMQTGVGRSQADVDSQGASARVTTGSAIGTGVPSSLPASSLASTGAQVQRALDLGALLLLLGVASLFAARRRRTRA